MDHEAIKKLIECETSSTLSDSHTVHRTTCVYWTPASVLSAPATNASSSHAPQNEEVTMMRSNVAMFDGIIARIHIGSKELKQLDYVAHLFPWEDVRRKCFKILCLVSWKPQKHPLSITK